MDGDVHSLDMRQLDTIDCPFHQQLLASLGDLKEELQQITREAESRAQGMEGPEEHNFMRGGVWEVIDNYNYAMVGLQAFLANLESEVHNLDHELGLLDSKKDELLSERDVLIEKGHELNCRIGYNALERKLEQTFTDTEKYTTVESARCFTDEAEENLRRINDHVRIGSLRICQIDRDLFNEMEKITCLFENYERDREHYVKELDLFCDVRKQRISVWLSQNRTEEERALGEDMLDYLSLSEKERHMEAQVIKNALRMYSFNASLTFDREDNEKLLDELTCVQSRVNAVSGLSVVVPRSAVARTDLTMMDSAPGVDTAENTDFEELLTTDHEAFGRGLHKCPRKVNLAFDPVTDPELLHKLDSALRWEENDGGQHLLDANASVVDEHEVLGEETAQVPSSSSSSPQENKEPVTPVCGDVLPPCHVLSDGHNVMDRSTPELRGRSKMQINDSPERTSGSTQNFLRHIESHTVIPGSADKHIVGILRKKKLNGRSVGSLTNVIDCENPSSRVSVTESQERLARSPATDSNTRVSTGGKKSREHVSTWEKE